MLTSAASAAGVWAYIQPNDQLDRFGLGLAEPAAAAVGGAVGAGGALALIVERGHTPGRWGSTIALGAVATGGTLIFFRNVVVGALAETASAGVALLNGLTGNR